jgi:pimeloyl-ACP methyl ester carboxylesterase
VEAEGEAEIDVVSRFVSIGDQGEDGDLRLLVHERREAMGLQDGARMCPPVVLMAPGIEGGLGPGVEVPGTEDAAAWGAGCDPKLLESSVYSRLGQALAADHDMLCVQVTWREVGGGLEAAATDLLLAMRWVQQRQSDRFDAAKLPSPEVWLMGFSFGGAALLTAADFLGVLDAAERPQLGAVALLATALAGPTTGGEDFEQRDLPRALHGIGAPVLLLQGTADSTVPPRASLDAFACCNSSLPGFKRLVLIHDGDHRFVAKRADTVSYLRSWAREQHKGTIAPLLPDGFQGFDDDEDLQQSVRRARAAGPERRAAAAAAARTAASAAAAAAEPLEIHVDAAQARLAVAMGRSDAEVEGRVKALRQDEAAQREQMEQMRAQIEMLKLKKRDMEQVTAMLAAKEVTVAHSVSVLEGNADGNDALPEEHPDDPQPEEEESMTDGAASGDTQQSEEAAWNEYGDMLESGLGELRALRAQLRG